MSRRALFALPEGAPYSYTHAKYDITSDDQRFIMFVSTAVGANLERLIVVENFLEELKAKVGRE